MDAIGVSAGGGYLQTSAQADYANAQVVAIGSGATATTAFTTATVVGLHANVGCWFRVGGVAAANTAGSDFLPANTTWMVKIPPGALLSFIQATVGGFVAVVPMLNQLPNPTPGPGPNPPPLDLVTGAVAAYGFRRLRTAYAGSAVQVMRASDSALQNIGFVGNDFDSASFSAFIGASSGTVNTWYDQSGNGYDMTVAASAPTVNLTGLNGKPTAVFNASTNLHHATTPVITVPHTVSAVTVRTSNFTAYNGIMGDDSGSLFALYFNNAANGLVIFDGGAISSPVSCTDSVAHSITTVFNAAASTITVDGTTTGTTGSTGNSFNGLRLGVENGGLSGNLSEAVYWSGLMSAGNIATLSANQKSYWGTP